MIFKFSNALYSRSRLSPTMRRNSCSTFKASKRRSSAASSTLKNASTNCARNSSKRSEKTYKRKPVVLYPVYKAKLQNYIAFSLCRSWMRTSPHQRRRSRNGCPSRRRTSSTSRRRRKPTSFADRDSIWTLSAAGSSGGFSSLATTLSKTSWERLAKLKSYVNSSSITAMRSMHLSTIEVISYWSHACL